MTKIKLVFALIGFYALAVHGAQQEQNVVVFQGGKTEITTRDIERYIDENTPPDPAEKAAILRRPTIYREMAEMLYTIQILAAEAENAPGFDKEQAEWMARIMYQRRIISDYRTKYVKKMLQDVDWEAMAEEEYKVNKQNYMTDEKVKASHILIKIDEGRNEDAAKSLAQEIRDRALKGEDFAKLAREYSDDPSAIRNSGSLGFFKRGQMAKPFEDVAFAMQKPGEISEVVRTPFGFHIIEYQARKAPEQIPYEVAKEKIKEKLQTQMGNKLWQDKLIAIRSSKDIKVDEKSLRELQQKYQSNTSKN